MNLAKQSSCWLHLVQLLAPLLLNTYPFLGISRQSPSPSIPTHGWATTWWVLFEEGNPHKLIFPHDPQAAMPCTCGQLRKLQSPAKFGVIGSILMWVIKIQTSSKPSAKPICLYWQHLHIGWMCTTILYHSHVPQDVCRHSKNCQQLNLHISISRWTLLAKVNWIWASV